MRPVNIRLTRTNGEVSARTTATEPGTLELLQNDWDKVYQRLTKTHDEHLVQLTESLSKLRGRFSEIASRAKSDLEASQFESLARWEKTHEIFLTVNETYAKIVGDTHHTTGAFSDIQLIAQEVHPGMGAGVREAGRVEAAHPSRDVRRMHDGPGC